MSSGRDGCGERAVMVLGRNSLRHRLPEVVQARYRRCQRPAHVEDFEQPRHAEDLPVVVVRSRDGQLTALLLGQGMGAGNDADGTCRQIADVGEIDDDVTHAAFQHVVETPLELVAFRALIKVSAGSEDNDTVQILTNHVHLPLFRPESMPEIGEGLQSGRGRTLRQLDTFASRRSSSLGR